MLSPIVPKKSLHTSLRIFATLLLTIVAVLFLKSGRSSAQENFPVKVGRIEGDDLQVVTTTPLGVETDAGSTVVAGGSDVTLRSGHALLSLDSGGEISICGPAHFKVLQSAGAITIALDYGTVHSSLDPSGTFTIYTPTIIATPISIAGGRRDVTLGLGQTGEMCVLTARGAMRVEPQFSDQSLIIPQGGSASLSGGQIESLRDDASACSCDYPRASLEPPKPQPSKVPEISALNHPLLPERAKTKDSPPPAVEPIYTVLMPALTFDANSPAPPPDPSPETILLVREVRLRPSAVYHGHVNPAPAQIAKAAAIPSPPDLPASSPEQSQPGLLDRMKNFFRKLSGRGPCVGAGCSN